MNKLLLLVLIYTVGCASMSEKVFTKIKVGDSASRVADVLGAPTIFQGSAEFRDGTVLVYREKNVACGFEIRKEVVREISCRSKASLQDQTSLLARVFIEEN